MHLSEVIDILVGSIPGQIIASNASTGIHHALIPREIASDALSWMGRLMDHWETKDPKSMVEALGFVRARHYPDNFSANASAPDFRLKGLQSDYKGDTEEDLSCVVRLKRLGNLVSRDERSRIVNFGVRLIESTDDNRLMNVVFDRMNEWNRLDSKDRKVQLNPESTLGPPGTVAWFTTRACLRQAINGIGGTKVAQRIRDALGLSHMSRGTPLVALHFPGELLRRVPSNRPTFVDAGEHTRFKAYPDSKTAQAKEQWGFTVDLEKLVNDEEEIDGCLERVTHAVTGQTLNSNGLTCEVEMLGFIESGAGSDEEADEKFAYRLLGDSTSQDLADGLKSLLNLPSKSGE